MLEILFNIDNGYLEGLIRGFKCGILKVADYHNLVQCETLEGTFFMNFVIIYCMCNFYKKGVKFLNTEGTI